MAIRYEDIYSDYITQTEEQNLQRERANVTSPYTGQINLPTNEQIMEDIDPLQTGMTGEQILSQAGQVQTITKNFGKGLDKLGINNPFTNPYATDTASGFAQTDLGGKIMYKPVETVNSVVSPETTFTDGGTAVDASKVVYQDATTNAIYQTEAAAVEAGANLENLQAVTPTTGGQFITDLTGGSTAAAAGKAGGTAALVGTGIKMLADDKDPTTMNVGETIGTGLQGGGTAMFIASKLGLAATAIPVIGIAAAAFALLRGKKKRDAARKAEKEREIQIATYNKYRESFDNYAARRQKFLSEQSKQQKDQGLVNRYSA